MSLTLSNASYAIDEQLSLAYFDSEYGKENSAEIGPGTTDEMNKTDKPVVVLMHGYCGSSAYFSKLVPLLQNDYRLLIPDLTGHGASAVKQEPLYSLAEQAALIADWLQAIGARQVALFGHSLGGYIALALAEQQPQLLRAFGLLHSTALPDTEQAKQNREQAIKTVQEQGVRAFVEGLVPKLLAPEHAEREQLLTYGIEIGYQTAPEAVIGFARGMKERPDRTAVIEQAKLPVLLVAGAKDGVIRPEATFSGKQAATSCHIIEAAGHMGMLEEPEKMASILRQFIG